MKRLALAALILTALPACGIVDFKEKAPDRAIYYVGSYNTSQSTYALAEARAIVVAIEYAGPDGTVRDTLRNTSLPVSVSGRFVAPPTSWSRVFLREELPEFRITATNLTPPIDNVPQGFVSVSLMLDDEVVAFDSSATSVSLSH